LATPDSKDKENEKDRFSHGEFVFDELVSLLFRYAYDSYRGDLWGSTSYSHGYIFWRNQLHVR